MDFWSIVLTVVVFICGMIIGIALNQIFSKRKSILENEIKEATEELWFEEDKEINFDTQILDLDEESMKFIIPTDYVVEKKTKAQLIELVHVLIDDFNSVLAAVSEGDEE